MTISKLQDMNNTQVSTNKIEISCKKKDREGNFWYQKKLWKKVEKKKRYGFEKRPVKKIPDFCSKNQPFPHGRAYRIWSLQCNESIFVKTAFYNVMVRRTSGPKYGF